MGSFPPPPRYPWVMDRLPLETLQQVFKLACTDGGYTGCSLALMSKSIREAAQSTRFHSIVLPAETERLVALVTLYQGQCSNAAGIRPRTSHLYEPTAEDEWDESEDEEEATSPTQSSLMPARFTAAQQLFSLVADDLQSLVITKDIFIPVGPIFDRPLRSLRELTLVRHSDPCTLIPRGSDILPLFPALTHLHIVAPDCSHPLLPGWIAHAPRVTHLRISAPNRIHQLIDALPDAVGTPAYPLKRGFRIGMAIDAPPAVRTYPTLARVVVEPGPAPVVGACGTSRKAYNSRRWQLEWVAAQARTAGVEMHVPSPCAWTEGEWDEAIRAEWLKRIGGEPGRDWFSDVEEEEEEEEDSEVAMQNPDEDGE